MAKKEEIDLFNRSVTQHNLTIEALQQILSAAKVTAFGKLVAVHLFLCTDETVDCMVLSKQLSVAYAAISAALKELSKLGVVEKIESDTFKVVTTVRNKNIFVVG